MASKEGRTYVRGKFPFQVRFRIILAEEYEAVRRTGKRYQSSHKKMLTIDGVDADKNDRETSLDSGLVEFLLYMDEKVDHIIAMLSKHEARGVFYEGRGLDISGAGMKLEVDDRIQSGQIIHAHFILSRFPLVVIDVFGEVVRVVPIDREGKKRYQLGIRFADISESDREKVIAYVFRRQREAIRGRKNGPDMITEVDTEKEGLP
jgi:hypothetical protein